MRERYSAAYSKCATICSLSTDAIGSFRDAHLFFAVPLLRLLYVVVVVPHRNPHRHLLGVVNCNKRHCNLRLFSDLASKVSPSASFPGKGSLSCSTARVSLVCSPAPWTVSGAPADALSATRADISAAASASSAAAAPTRSAMKSGAEERGYCREKPVYSV